MSFQVYFTLFTKYFLFFPRGTSLLSVFTLYLGFGVYYHHFNLHFQVNLLFFLINPNRNIFVIYKAFTLYCWDFNPNSTIKKFLDSSIHFGYTSNVWLSYQTLTSALRAFTTFDSTNLAFVLFTRRYWRHHCCFLFLPLLICLSYGSSLTHFKFNLNVFLKSKCY